MNADTASFRIVRRSERIACAVAGLTCSAGIFCAIVLCFNAVSPDTWLLPTPALTASLAQCDRQPSRAAQTECKKRVIAMNLTPDAQLAQLATH